MYKINKMNISGKFVKNLYKKVQEVIGKLKGVFKNAEEEQLPKSYVRTFNLKDIFKDDDELYEQAKKEQLLKRNVRPVRTFNLKDIFDEEDE